MMIKCMAAFLIFAVISYSAGAWLAYMPKKCKASGVSFSQRFALGGCLTLLTGMVSVLAGGVFSLSARAAFYIMLSLLIILCIAGNLLKKRKGTPAGAGPGRRRDLYDVIIYIAVLALFVLQVYAVMHYEPEQSAHMKCIASATAVYESGCLRVADPMMLLIGMLSSVSGIHPLIIIYVLSPVPLLMLYHMCYLGVLEEILPGRGPMVGLIIVMLLNMRGFQSQMLMPATLLVSWYGLWVFVIHGLMNIAAIFALRRCRHKEAETDKAGSYEDDYLEEWDMKKHRIINARNLAIAVGVLCIALISLAFILNRKINALHDVAAVLQNDMDDRCGLYEFTGSDGRVDGYLLKSGDGTLTFVGGGNKENADELKAFLEKYGDSVTNWYIYGEDEENSGAMRALISSGAFGADNVYVIDRKEIRDIR